MSKIDKSLAWLRSFVLTADHEPNKETEGALRDAHEGNVKTFDTIEELFEDLKDIESVKEPIKRSDSVPYIFYTEGGNIAPHK